MKLSLSIPVVVTLSAFAQALLVEPASPQCADLCGNSLASTSGAEMTCNDAGYATSTYGATYKACVACELNSTYYEPGTQLSDLHWAIYNMRYALSWCLFGFDNNTGIETPCLTRYVACKYIQIGVTNANLVCSFSCQPLTSAFEYDGLNSNASSYSFCPIFTTNAASIPKCSSCLQQMGNENYLANCTFPSHSSFKHTRRLIGINSRHSPRSSL
jgi:hypothetical protein